MKNSGGVFKTIKYGILGGSVFFTTMSALHARSLWQKDKDVFTPHEVLVKLANPAQLERLFEHTYQDLGLYGEREPLLQTATGAWYRVKINPRLEMASVLQFLQDNNQVLKAQPNYRVHLITPVTQANNLALPAIERPDYQDPKELPIPPKEEDLSRLWGLAQVKTQQAWSVTKGNKKLIVADIDTGVDYNHPDLINNMWHNPGESGELKNNGIDDDHNGLVDDYVGYDFVGNNSRPYDDHSHGTHTSGTIAAVKGNGLGIAGVAPQVSIMALKFLAADGEGDTAGAIKCFQYALAQGARVLSNSWGGDEYSEPLHEALKELAAHDVLTIFAAGNESSDNDKNPTYPASYTEENMIVVAATTSRDRLAGYSNWGINSVHLAAPGSNILSTIPDGRYTYMDGTSMATPHVAGAAALLRSTYPALTAVQIKELLLKSVDSLNTLQGRVTTGGRMNIEKAFELAKQSYGTPEFTDEY